MKLYHYLPSGFVNSLFAFSCCYVWTEPMIDQVWRSDGPSQTDLFENSWLDTWFKELLQGPVSFESDLDNALETDLCNKKFSVSLVRMWEDWFFLGPLKRSATFRMNEWMNVYLYTEHISRRFTILIEWDRTSACKGASGCRYQSIFDLTHPPSPCMKCTMKQQIDHHTGNYAPYSFRQVCGFFNVPCWPCNTEDAGDGAYGL